MVGAIVHCITPQAIKTHYNREGAYSLEYPRRMHEGYSSRYCVCVSGCVCYHASYYIPHLYVENKVPLSFLCHFLHMYCVDFIKNALFRSSCNICWPPLPSLLLDRLSMDKRGSDGFVSRWLAYRSSNKSYNSTDSSLVMVNCQLPFLTWTVLC